MPTARDAFDAIEKIATKQTRTVDKKGFADKFKEAAETFFINVKKYGKEILKQEITIKDIEYHNGYFIFIFFHDSSTFFSASRVFSSKARMSAFISDKALKGLNS